VRPGEVGRLEVKGRTVFAGYWNNHALTCEAFRRRLVFHGDVARQEADGHIVQLDREVDVIEARSGPVYSLPIEEKLHVHPAVHDLCVYGARQADGSQAPAAAVALRQRFRRRVALDCVGHGAPLDAKVVDGRVDVELLSMGSE
jgi:acyl-CoA synthetase (AMP-forming)/AMP-acid ligase II